MFLSSIVSEVIEIGLLIENRNYVLTRREPTGDLVGVDTIVLSPRSLIPESQNLCHSAVSIQCEAVTDGPTDRQTGGTRPTQPFILSGSINE